VKVTLTFQTTPYRYFTAFCYTCYDWCFFLEPANDHRYAGRGGASNQNRKRIKFVRWQGSREKLPPDGRAVARNCRQIAGHSRETAARWQGSREKLPSDSRAVVQTIYDPQDKRTIAFIFATSERSVFNLWSRTDLIIYCSFIAWRDCLTRSHTALKDFYNLLFLKISFPCRFFLL
jgi:hypothetical protein